MQKIIVTGSIAYDHIMTFNDTFSNTILPNQLSHLSISYLAQTHDFYFGGTAPNIAFTLKILGEDPIIISVAGNDFDQYKDWLLNKNNIKTDFIDIDEEKHTAAAYILSDKRHNQISIFSPNAMNNLTKAVSLQDKDLSGVFCAVIAPDIPERMVRLSKEFNRHKVPYIFDPGQAMSSLNSEQLETLILNSKGLILNQYEADLIIQKTDQTLMELQEKTAFIVVTQGEKGAKIYKNGVESTVPAIIVDSIIDVTGCGDAFRAGFLHGYVNQATLTKCVQYGNTASAFVIEQKGTQNHCFTYDAFINRVKENYGE